MRVFNRFPITAVSLLILLVFSAVPVFAQTPERAPETNPSVKGPPDDLDFESLLGMKVVTASRFSQNLADAPGVVSVVTADELQRFGGSTLLEVLQRAAGINISTAFLGDFSQITIRGDQTGSGASHILFLINGRPVRENLDGGVTGDILESFPIAVLDRIEIVKGPGSVLYGSGAFSGVVNLITKKAEGQEFNFKASAGAAGEKALSEQGQVRRGALNIVEGVQFHQWPSWNVVGFKGVVGQPVGETALMNFNGVGAYLGLEYKGFTFMSSYTGQEAPTFVFGVVGDSRLKRGFSDFGYRLSVSPKWDMTFNLTYDRSIMEVPQFPSIHRDSYEGDLEWTNFISLSQSDRLTFGAAYTHISGTESFLGVTPAVAIAQGSRDSGEGYVELEHKLTAGLKVVGGVQVNRIGAITLNAVPRGGILWSPFYRWSVKLLYGGAYNAPALDPTLINHPGLIGNPNLTSEKVGTLDAEVSWQGNRFQTGIGYFHSRQSSLIGLNVITSPLTFINYANPVTFQGVETEGKYYIARDWLALGSFLFQTNNSGSGSANLSPGPAVAAKAGLSYMSPKGVTVSGFDAYQAHSAGFGSGPNPPASAFHSVSGHARVDLSRHWIKNDNTGFALFLDADDLLNHQVWLPSLGSVAQITQPVIKGRTVAFGIEVWHKPPTR